MGNITIKTPEDIAGMRVAGRLASEVLDFITPHVTAGVSTDQLDKLCHDYMVNVQGVTPAPLNYCPPGYTPYPKSVCTSVNDVVCHGIPGDKVLKLGDVVNIDVTVIADLTVVQGYPFTFQIYMEVLPSTTNVSNNGFDMTGSSGCAPITVNFTNNNPGMLSYYWNFGNGNISLSENPVPQVYTIPGDYLVYYTAWNSIDTTDVYTLTNLNINNMSNYFTEQQQLLAQMVRDFAEREIRPQMKHWDDHEIFPIEVMKKMGELG
jgi:hypothetical protein